MSSPCIIKSPCRHLTSGTISVVTGIYDLHVYTGADGQVVPCKKKNSHFIYFGYNEECISGKQRLLLFCCSHSHKSLSGGAIGWVNAAVSLSLTPNRAGKKALLINCDSTASFSKSKIESAAPACVVLM